MKAKLLYSNSKIGVFCGSRQVHEKDVAIFRQAIQYFKNNGFDLVVDPNLYAKNFDDYYEPEQRAAFFNELVKREDVGIIFSCKGGVDCNALLDYIDFKAIKQNPKIYCGYSDLTTLVNVINNKTGLITFFGPNFKLYGKEEADICRFEFFDKFAEGNNFLGQEDDKYSIIRPGIASGKIVGGTLCTLPYCATGKYKIDFTDKILLLEDYADRCEPLRIYGLLYHLKQNGVFDNLKGIWVGNYNEKNGFSLEDAIKNVTSEFSYPIIKSNNFGHILSNMTIPIGANAEINTNNLIPIKLTENYLEKGEENDLI